MKKLIALVIAAIMVLSLIPVMTFTVSAKPESVEYPEPSEDFWSVWRDPSDYDLEEDEPYRPACGYAYTSRGFEVYSPVFGNYGTKANVQTSQPVDLKDGFYMQVCIDDFSYKGESGAEDEWISFAISDQRAVGAGGSEWSNNWLCLIRGTGDGTASNMSFVTVRDTDTKNGSFTPVGSFADCTPEVIDGKEYYTFEVIWDGTAFTLKVNGCAVTGATGQITKHLQAMEQTFVSVVLHSGQMGGKADLTITQQGNSADDAFTPEGNDSRDPEENLLVYGDLIDPSTVEAGKPALVLDANKTSIKDDPSGSNMALTPTADGSYHVKATGEVPYFMWSIKKEITYNSTDFPVFVMMLKNFIGNDGGAYFCAGNVISATDKYMQGWTQWDDNARFYGPEEEYTYIVLDLSDMINNDEALQGRIHQIRPHFGVDPSDEEMSEWDITFCAFFRDVDEALEYGDWYAEEYLTPEETETETETDAATETDTDAATETDTDAATETDTDAATETDTDAATETDTDAATGTETDAATGTETDAATGTETDAATGTETDAATGTETDAATGTETDAATGTETDAATGTTAGTTAETEAEDGGCASIVGFGAVAVVVAAAAAVVLKKKD